MPQDSCASLVQKEWHTWMMFPCSYPQGLVVLLKESGAWGQREQSDHLLVGKLGSVQIVLLPFYKTSLCCVFSLRAFICNWMRADVFTGMHSHSDCTSWWKPTFGSLEPSRLLFCSQNYADVVKLPWQGFPAVKQTGSNFWFKDFKYYRDNLLTFVFFVNNNTLLWRPYKPLLKTFLFQIQAKTLQGL